MGAAFSTLELFERFEEVGIPEKQARLFADLFSKTQKTEDVPTRSDVAHDLKTLEIQVDNKFDRIDHKLDQIRNEFKGDIEQACSKLDNKISNKINELKFDIVKWMIGLFFAQAGLTVAIVTGLRIFGH